MCNCNEGNISCFIQIYQDVFYLLSGFRVKVSCWFISQYYLRFHYERSCHGNPLLLPSGKFPWLVSYPIIKSHFIQDNPGHFYRFLFRHAIYQCRHHHIFQAAELRQEMMELENKSYLSVSEFSQFIFIPVKNIYTIEEQGPGGRLIQCPQYMKEGAFPRTGNTKNCQGFTSNNFKIQSFQYLDLIAVLDEGFC